ncbi:NF038104 family lipoprotein [Faucicola mancuniensis]|uniref:NF038104 family lipoprotein n=1 Tax=Faucicola mancuniensis TaxID=1309795 RepID=UPI0028E67C33|nr:NF038104 family lipoprotein [uncultured Moraxella sp.]
MSKIAMLSLFVVALSLQGCVHKIVTVPAKVAYKTTKGVVKGTTKVVKAVVPGGSDKDKND